MLVMVCNDDDHYHTIKKTEADITCSRKSKYLFVSPSISGDGPKHVLYISIWRVLTVMMSFSN